MDGMTQAKWDAMTPAERDKARDLSGLTPQLVGLEGCRVEVTDDDGTVRRFKVGRSTGWVPCHLEVYNARSLGGGAARKSYRSVRVIHRP